MTEIAKQELPHAVLPVDGAISLRQLNVDEAEVIFSLVDSNRDYLLQWLPWVAHTTSPTDSAQFITEMIRKRQEGSEYGYAICVDDRPVGHMSLMHLNDDNDPEIGYWISSSVAGQGVTTKAARALTDFGLKTLGLHRIIIQANPDNIASNKVAEKLGYVLEGTTFSERLKETVNIWSMSSPQA